TLLPKRYTRANLVDHSSHLVTRDTRVVQSGPVAFFHKQVAMTDPTGLHFDANLVGAGCGDLALYDFELPSRRMNLNRGHLRHVGLLRVLWCLISNDSLDRLAL